MTYHKGCAAKLGVRLNVAGMIVVSASIAAGSIRAQSPAYHPDGTSLLHAEGAQLPFATVTITRSMDNGGRPFSLAITDKGLSAVHTSLKDLIRFAYHAKSYDQIIGGPDWITKEFYDVTATWSDSALALMNTLPGDQVEPAVRRTVASLLASRFHLEAGIQTRNLPVYALVVADGGPKLEAAAPSSGPASLVFTSPTQVSAKAQSTHTLADFLSIFDELGGRLIVDATGLTGNYDFVINGVSPARSQHPETTSIFTAIRDQLGLALEPRKATGVEVLVVRHAERPSLSGLTH